MSLDMNTIDHVWDVVDRKVKQRNPQCQIIAELINSFQEEWLRFPQNSLCRLVRRMNRRVREIWHKSGVNKRY